MKRSEERDTALVIRQGPVQVERASKTPTMAGFSLVELIITIAIGLIIATMGLPAIYNFVSRSHIEGTARQFATTMHAAKIEAIKTGFPAVVRIDPVDNVLQAHLNIDDPGDEWAYDPDDSKPYQTTDYLIRQVALPEGVTFGGPGGAGERFDGLTVDPGGGDPLMIFEADGSIRDIGAYRIGDLRGNFLEARVEPRGTARTELRKWNRDLTIWAAAGQEGNPWQWY